MALFSVDFYSKSLFRPVNFKLFVPNDVPPEMKMGNTYYERPTKILVLLHGYNGGNLDWALYSNASEISSKYNLAVILPSGENSFYLDSEATGHKYATFVGQELIDYVRNTFHLSSRKEDTFVGGLSMGGFGAIHTALQFPDTFEKAFSLSGALIVHNVEKMAPGFKDMVANYDYYKSVFGDPAFVLESDNNPETQIKSSKKKIIAFPDCIWQSGQKISCIRRIRYSGTSLKKKRLTSNTTKARVSMILCSGMQTLNLLYGGFWERVSNEKV